MDSQDQGMYYTNLLHGNSIVSLEDSPLLPTNPISVKKSTRGVNFIPEEDKLLVSAWLNHSLDAIQGTDQKYSQLWEKIFEYFQQHKETTEIFELNISAFLGCYTEILPSIFWC
ncbi:hypothetical protein HanRHA438_Chr13g0615331 [Helianthus annuus]|nr:hypothetical protein HanXRQr2_Chr13g0604861 [Helianthus annuus]KAJ0850615.1 hypothetical protein HanPSC8_Chr13g0582871 [Helianthus annuus]KAJ0859678.1 hypothetical protein HanRHA438_Chr13g0615331 [Helianthus annuus]